MPSSPRASPTCLPVPCGHLRPATVPPDMGASPTAGPALRQSRAICARSRVPSSSPWPRTPGSPPPSTPLLPPQVAEQARVRYKAVFKVVNLITPLRTRNMRRSLRRASHCSSWQHKNWGCTIKLVNQTWRKYQFWEDWI